LEGQIFELDACTLLTESQGPSVQGMSYKVSIPEGVYPEWVNAYEVLTLNIDDL
jgi:hypothetical protein